MTIPVICQVTVPLQIPVHHCIKESGVVVLYHKYHEGEVFNYDEQKNLQEI